MHGLEHAGFADHVVRFGSDRSQRRAPQHVLSSVDAQQVSEIRMAAGKLLDVNAVIDSFDLAAQMIG